ncbi:inner centromere protein-like [Oscarella lobularis]|uniref:inner centromere protein-like n=1 Tax=Oscarella lobularis TaxID=121494 RepID=UPI0033144489
MHSKKHEERLVLPPLPRDPTRPRNKKKLDISRVPVLPFLNRQPQEDRQLNSRAFDLQYKRRRPPSLNRRSEPLFPLQNKASESTESFEWELEMALNAGRGRYRTFSEPVPLPQHDQNNRPMTRHVSERFKLPPMQLQHVRGLDNQYQTGRMYHARPGGNPAIYLSELQSKYGIRSNEKESRPTSRVSSYAHIPPIVINEVETRPQSKHLPLRPSTPDSGLQSDFHSEIDALPNIVPDETTDQEAEKSPTPTLAPDDEGINEEIAASSVSTLVVDHEPPPEVHTPAEEKVDNPEEPPAPMEVQEPVVEPHVVEEETTKVSLPEPCVSPPPPSPPPTLSFETKESDPEPVILTQTEPVPVQPVVEKENTPPPPPIEKDVPKIDFETTVEPVESEKEEEMEFVIVAAESTSSSAASLPAISYKEETVDVPKKKAKPKEKQERKKIEKKKKRQPVRERPKREKIQEKETEEEEEIITVDEEPAPPSPAIEELEDSRPNSAEERERLRKEKEAEREKRRMAKKAKRERQKREREAKKEAEEIKDTSPPKPTEEDTIIRESESLHECPHHESDTYDYEKELEDEAERLRLEEEERQRELDALRKAREEEERRAREEEEERRRLELRREQLEAQRRLEEERRRAEEEMRARIRRQLDEERARKMNRLVAMSQLQIEMGNLEEEHRVTRAFVWSYFRVEEPEQEAYEN